MTAPSEPTGLPIPTSHLDLFDRPICAVLTTLGLDGQPQSSLVWVDYDGECARVNTGLDRRKGANLRRNRRVSLLIVDPDTTARFVQVRGDAELLTDGALEHLDTLTRKYTGRPRYHGYVYSAARQQQETSVVVRIHARRVTLDAIHA